MSAILSPRLQAVALSVNERVSLFVAGDFRFRPWWVERKKPTGDCDCGKWGTHRCPGGDWECDACATKNATVEHAQDKPFKLDSEEWEDSRERNLEYHKQYNRTRRNKVNRSIDNGGDACRSGETIK